MKFSDVAKDSIKFAKENPVKSSIYGSIGLFSLTCYKTNPTYHHFTDQIRAAQNTIGLVYQESQNLNTIRFLKYLEQCRNEQTIRFTSLALFSVVWVHDYSSELSTSEAKCEYIQPQFSTLFDRIVDVGFMGKFWNIERQMKNYDVNL